MTDTVPVAAQGLPPQVSTEVNGKLNIRFKLRELLMGQKGVPEGTSKGKRAMHAVRNQQTIATDIPIGNTEIQVDTLNTAAAAMRGWPQQQGRREALVALAGLGAAIALPTSSQAATTPDPTIAELAALYASAWTHLKAAGDVQNDAEWRLDYPEVPEVLFLQRDDPMSTCFSSQSYCGRQWFGGPEQIAMLRAWPVAFMTRNRRLAPVVARR